MSHRSSRNKSRKRKQRKRKAYKQKAVTASKVKPEIQSATNYPEPFPVPVSVSSPGVLAEFFIAVTRQALWQLLNASYTDTVYQVAITDWVLPRDRKFRYLLATLLESFMHCEGMQDWTLYCVYFVKSTVWRGVGGSHNSYDLVIAFRTPGFIDLTNSSKILDFGLVSIVKDYLGRSSGDSTLLRQYIMTVLQRYNLSDIYFDHRWDSKPPVDYTPHTTKAKHLLDDESPLRSRKGFSMSCATTGRIPTNTGPLNSTAVAAYNKSRT